jgi:hypothetical protein
VAEHPAIEFASGERRPLPGGALEIGGLAGREGGGAVTADHGAALDEEPWEAEIGALLARLPSVDPPEGFIDAALRQGPLHAGRILSGLAALTVATVVGVVWTGAAGRTAVAPPVDELAARHATIVRAGVFPGGSFDRLDPAAEAPVELPRGFRLAGDVEAEDIRQAVYARGDESVSVFVQEGRMSWDALPAGGSTEIGGRQAWVDPARRLTVIETGERIVTIVGLGSDEVAEVLAGVRGEQPSTWDRIHDLAEAIVIQLGYAPAE